MKNNIYVCGENIDKGDLVCVDERGLLVRYESKARAVDIIKDTKTNLEEQSESICVTTA